MVGNSTQGSNIHPAPVLRKRGRRSTNAPQVPTPPRNQAFDAATVALGARIKDARKRRGMTQSDLAQSDFSKSYVSAVERGKIRPSIQALQLLATRLNLQVAALLAQQTEEESTNRGEQTQNSLYAAEWHLYNGRPEQVLQVLQGITSEELAMPQNALYHYLAGRAALDLNRNDEALKHLERALAMVKDTDDQEAIERVRVAAGRAYAIAQGKSPAALERQRQSLEAIEKGVVRDPHLQLDILQALSGEFLRQGVYEEVLRLSERAYDLRHQVMDWRYLAETYWHLAEEAREANNPYANRYAEKALALMEFLDDITLAARLQSNIAQALAQTRQHEAAMESVNEAMAVASQSNDPSTISKIYTLLAQFASEQQNYAQAHEAAENALKYSQLGNDRRSRAQALLTMANVEEAAGHFADADRQYEEAIQELEALGDTEALSAAYHRYGRSLTSRGDSERGAKYLEQAYLSLTRS